MPRETREQRREREIAERRTSRVAEFREKIDRERAKRVYSDRAVFEAANTDDRRDLGAMALYELVHEFQRRVKNLRREIGRAQDRLAEAVVRIDAGRGAASYSNGILGGAAADIEREEMAVQTLSTAIARTAWALGWHVAEIAPDYENAKREKLVHVGVSADGSDDDGEIWRLVDSRPGRTFAIVSEKDLGLSDREDRLMLYRSEESAWIAAMAYCGETV